MPTQTGNMPRRSFLKAAAGAIAVPLFIPSSAFGANDRINVGVIGVGKQGEYHLGHLVRNQKEHCRVVAIAECYKKFRDQAVETAGGPNECKGYNDFRELLARPDIDAVLIALPDHWHAIPAIEACRAGKDVYCEKPLSLTIREAREMASAARQYARVFQTGSQQRSSSEFRRACELVRNGYIGDIKEVIVSIGGPARYCDLPPEPTPEGLDWEMWLGPAPERPFNAILRPPHNDSFPNWRNYWDYSGGGMTDWGAHHFDIAQWGLGMDESGPAEIIPPNGRDVKDLTYIYASGIPMRRADGPGVRFIGTKGRIDVNRGMLRTDPGNLRTLDLAPNDLRLYNSPNHHTDWFTCIRTRQRPICDVETGCRSVTVCHLGNIAYRLNRPLKWDPQKEHFIGDDLANRMLSRAYREPWTL